MFRVPPIALALLASACARISGLDDVTPTRDAAVDTAIDASCLGTVLNPPDEGTNHATIPQPVAYTANPPTSGTHYNSWARWDGTYTTAIPRPYWVHNLEHGGVVLLYNCTDCQTDIDALTALMARLPADTACAAPIRNRLIVTADPMLPNGVRFAASAWNFSYTTSCLDTTDLEMFVTRHYGNAGVAPEAMNCNQGDFPVQVAPAAQP